MVHSILFSGYILDAEIEPDEMISEEVSKSLADTFNKAVEEHKRKLPRRTPFSCLLHMVGII